MAAKVSASIPSVTVALAKPEDLAEVWLLLQEYFEAVDVAVRDEREAVARQINDGQGGFWLAYVNGQAAGCIALRPLTGGPLGDTKCGEIKRLYVRPRFRRLGIAAGLLSALETHARTIGLQNLYSGFER